MPVGSVELYKRKVRHMSEGSLCALSMYCHIIRLSKKKFILGWLREIHLSNRKQMGVFLKQSSNLYKTDLFGTIYKNNMLRTLPPNF